MFSRHGFAMVIVILVIAAHCAGLWADAGRLVRTLESGRAAAEQAVAETALRAACACLSPMLRGCGTM